MSVDRAASQAVNLPMGAHKTNKKEKKRISFVSKKEQKEMFGGRGESNSGPFPDIAPA